MELYDRRDIDNSWYQWELRNNGGCIGFGLYFVVVVMLVLMCSSCTTSKIEYRDRVVDNYITKVVHDTLKVEVKDSTYHTIITRNDTVFDTKFVERTRWRDRIVEKYDTCWRDSIVVEYKETTKEVVKIPKIYRYAMIFSIICIIFVGIKVYKWLKIV